jgi:hypothetical protein
LRDANIVAEALTAVQAHLLVGKVLDRIELPKPDEGKQALAPRCLGDGDGLGVRGAMDF